MLRKAPQPEAAGARPDLTSVDVTNVDFLQQATLPFASETHAGDDVAVFAWGPYAHAFHGVVEQNLIYHVMAKAAGLSQDAASLTAPAKQDTAAVQTGTAQQ